MHDIEQLVSAAPGWRAVLAPSPDDPSQLTVEEIACWGLVAVELDGQRERFAAPICRTHEDPGLLACVEPVCLIAPGESEDEALSDARMILKQRLEAGRDWLRNR